MEQPSPRAVRQPRPFFLQQLGEHVPERNRTTLILPRLLLEQPHHRLNERACS